MAELYQVPCHCEGDLVLRPKQSPFTVGDCFVGLTPSSQWRRNKKSPEPVGFGTWISSIQSQAVAGSQNARVAAAAWAVADGLKVCFMDGIISLSWVVGNWEFGALSRFFLPVGDMGTIWERYGMACLNSRRSVEGWCRRIGEFVGLTFGFLGLISGFVGLTRAADSLVSKMS